MILAKVVTPFSVFQSPGLHGGLGVGKVMVNSSGTIWSDYAMSRINAY